MKLSKDDLVPKSRVLDDMNSDNVVARAARDYYKLYYASPEELKQMEREDKVTFGATILVCVAIVIAVIVGIVVSFDMKRGK